MPNWCSNVVAFKGGQSQMEELKQLFEAMALKQKKEERGQLPDFITGATGYFFDIAWESDVLYYETKWSENTAELKIIADRYGAGFVSSYSEPGNGVFGETTYRDGELTDIFLTHEDFDQYEFDELAGTYLFEGERYENSDEILEILLERKKAIKDLQE